MSEYVDTSRIMVRPITKQTAKRFVVKHHYSHRFSSCRYALGVYYLEEHHPFFEGENEKLIGAVIFGHPVGRRTAASIVKDDSLEEEAVLELTRLVILDEYGKNTESYVLGQCFRWLKKNDPSIKVLISYADPEYDHRGIIYQSTNWIYQGIGVSRLMPDYSIQLREGGPWIHSRTVGAKFGEKKLEKLAARIGHKFRRREDSPKHRYLYFLCGKKEKKQLLKQLKFPPQEYPHTTGWKPAIHTVQLIDGELQIDYE